MYDGLSWTEVHGVSATPLIVDFSPRMDAMAREKPQLQVSTWSLAAREDHRDWQPAKILEPGSTRRSQGLAAGKDPGAWHPACSNCFRAPLPEITAKDQLILNSPGRYNPVFA